MRPIVEGRTIPFRVFRFQFMIIAHANAAWDYEERLKQ